MTPSARYQTAVDLLTAIDAAPRPADAVMSAFFRDRRYIGSKDRSAVAELVYTILRRHARLAWWLDRVRLAPTPRALVFADMILSGGRGLEDVERSFSGGKFAPEPLDANELGGARALIAHTLEHPDMPEAIAVECPAWAEASLRAALGARFAAEMRAMLSAAPLDLRVNPIKTDRERAAASLREAGIQTEPSRLSPVGLRARGRPALPITQAFKDGWVEIQDEGSQLVALAVAAKPGQQVVDFCAGAGGKTLAVAAMMENKGRVVACDVLEGRLKRAGERFRRAGLHNIETHPLSGERDPWVKRHKRMFDRVLVDAPCSGTGTWRRNPDARRRQLGPGLSELLPTQAAILDSASRLVKPGGRLIYATCSLLPEENEDQIQTFLAVHPEFAVRSIADVWGELGITGIPIDGAYLRLSPGRHDTDGFFAAVLTRAGEDVPAVVAPPNL